MSDSLTTQAGAFAQAVRNVALFAFPDPTLPSIAGVHLEYDGKQLTLTATDRYTVATQVLTILDGDGGHWCAWLTAEAVAEIRRGISTGRKYRAERVTVAPRPDGGAEIAAPGGAAISSAPDPHSPSFPLAAMRRMAAGFRPAGYAETLRFDPALLARFASVGGRGTEPMTLTPGAPAADGKAYPVHVTCGPVEALVMTKHERG